MQSEIVLRKKKLILAKPSIRPNNKNSEILIPFAQVLKSKGELPSG
jgi:hypothetical protein